MYRIQWLEEVLADAAANRVVVTDSPIVAAAGEEQVGELNEHEIVLYSALARLTDAYNALVDQLRDSYRTDMLLESALQPPDLGALKQLETRREIVLQHLWAAVKDRLNLHHTKGVGIRDGYAVITRPEDDCAGCPMHDECGGSHEDGMPAGGMGLLFAKLAALKVALGAANRGRRPSGGGSLIEMLMAQGGHGGHGGSLAEMLLAAGAGGGMHPHDGLPPEMLLLDDEDDPFGDGDGPMLIIEAGPGAGMLGGNGLGGGAFPEIFLELGDELPPGTPPGNDESDGSASVEP